MLTEESPQLDRTFAALADPTRRAILAQLSSGEQSAGRLAGRFPISAPAVSRHLRVLESAGLITRRVDGKHRRCRLRPEPLRTVVQWLEFYRQFWSESLKQLADHFEAAPAAAAAARTRNPKPPKRRRHGRAKHGG